MNKVVTKKSLDIKSIAMILAEKADNDATYVIIRIILISEAIYYHKHSSKHQIKIITNLVIYKSIKCHNQVGLI